MASKFNSCDVADGEKLFQVTLDGVDYIGSASDETEALRQARLVHPQDVRSLLVSVIDAVPAEQSEADLIREMLVANPSLTNKQVIESLAAQGVKVTSPQVTAARAALKAE